MCWCRMHTDCSHQTWWCIHWYLTGRVSRWKEKEKRKINTAASSLRLNLVSRFLFKSIQKQEVLLEETSNFVSSRQEFMIQTQENIPWTSTTHSVRENERMVLCHAVSSTRTISYLKNCWHKKSSFHPLCVCACL